MSKPIYGLLPRLVKRDGYWRVEMPDADRVLTSSDIYETRFRIDALRWCAHMNGRRLQRLA
jgi:hypothetical protein